MSESKAMILGCAGTTLSDEERAFYDGERPWGFILFARNIAEPEQVRDLAASLRDAVGRKDAAVFIDQEGGKVQRLRPPIAPNYPAAATLGALARHDREAGMRAAWLLSRLHAFDLRKLGITADCMPVLDVPVEGANDVIGVRAYGRDPEMVAAFGRAAADGLIAGGVLPVMKHVPGHGRAFADSHLALPRVDAPLEALRARDFAPFRTLNHLPAAMTAHVVFEAIDPTGPATTSHTVITDIVRGEIGFDGLLISDDTSMKALSGDFPSKAEAILAAGCDLVLHCNGVMQEMVGIASRTTVLAGRSLDRADRAMAVVGGADGMAEAAVRAEFGSYFEAVA
ncbi:MAG: beta-N-acetylhexosaminidase [Rhizobiaceae bacterium]